MNSTTPVTTQGPVRCAGLRSFFPLAVLLTALAEPVAGATQGGPLLRNAGFEETNLLAAWRTWVYQDGKAPVIRADAAEAHEGTRSLLVAAEDPADVALGQEVDLPAGSVWRARCWVKTANLVARDRTDTGAALHLQTASGATVARSPSTFGTSTWKQIETVFRVPADGRVKVTLFFIGYGKGTGRAWFDDIQLERQDAAGVETVAITTERLTRGPVDAKQGGQFIEPLCNLIPSLLAQQVANTSFEVDPPWNVAFRREVDRPYRPWYPDGAVHLARYTFDTNQPFNGKRSLRIELSAPHARAGISQDGFHLEKGMTYRLRLHVRGTGGVVARASLHGGGSCAAGPVTLGRASESWQPATATLRAARTLDHATLTIDFEGPGTLWLDRVSLIDDNAVLGLWRPDATEAVRALSPGVIRFGGSALETYEWDQCLGPADARAPFPQTYWGGLEENYVGVEEFVQYCQALGAEPLVCVRWSGKKPADAAAEVEYFNGSTETTGGRRRAALGHRAPYRVKYWQIGNEVAGPAYEGSMRSFAEAMRQVDPSIKVLSSFPSPDMLRIGGGLIDYLCPHHYGCADLLAMEQDFASLEERIRQAPAGRAVRIAVTEWNTTAGDWELARATLQTLDNALSVARYHNLMQRHADSVEIAIRSNLIDSFGSGVILTGPGWLYVAPAYHAQRLYARAAGSYPVRLERHAGQSGARLPWNLEEPDLSAVLSPDGHILRLYAVNSTSRDLEMKAVLSGFSGKVTRGQIQVLRDAQAAATAQVLNSRDEPDRVRVFASPARIKGSAFPLRLPPFSLTLCELELGK